MKIVLVGGGKVGAALARQLSEEGHNVTVVDTNKTRVEHIGESYDVMSILGNGSSITTLSEAGVEDADVFIAVTGSDELNLLCCMFAKKAGHCHAIARVRNPSYSHELDFIKKQIGISAIINPEMAAAKEISHLLRFPGASKIDTFAGGRVRLIKFALTEQQGLDGVAIHEIPTRLKSDILVCAVERDGGVIIPNGNFVLQKGDQVTFLATQEKAHAFFQQLHLPVQPVRNALIVGGGAIAYYLSQELLENHVRVRIVERDAARCVELAEQLPGAQILNEDGSNREFLLSEGLESTEAFVALTNIDEENVLLTLFAKKHSNGKLVTKVKLDLLKYAPDCPLAIVDGSPGIGCPVIASVGGMDLVLVVAEPSPSGISDLERLVKTAGSFRVKLAVCVNRWDISPENTEKIRAFCLEQGIPFLGCLPYDKSAPLAINQGLSAADVDCHLRDALAELWGELRKLLGLEAEA